MKRIILCLFLLWAAEETLVNTAHADIYSDMYQRFDAATSEIKISCYYQLTAARKTNVIWTIKTSLFDDEVKVIDDFGEEYKGELTRLADRVAIESASRVLRQKVWFDFDPIKRDSEKFTSIFTRKLGDYYGECFYREPT